VLGGVYPAKCPYSILYFCSVNAVPLADTVFNQPLSNALVNVAKFRRWDYLLVQSFIVRIRVIGRLSQCKNEGIL
jgi:hypothetical protein